jgi:hypothetical protein
LLEVTRAVAPLVTAVIILQFTVTRAPADVFLQFLVGAVMVIAGLVFFLLGIEVGMLPAGKIVGSGLTQRGSLWLIIAVAFLIGFATTIAEPDVLVLAGRADTITQGAVPQNSLLYVIGIGVAFFTAMAMARIILGFRMAYLLAGSYVIVIVLSFFTPVDFVSLAFDSGSVTTGVLTAPILIALGLGLSSMLAGRAGLSDGFGLLGLASVGPIIAVMIMGIVTN